MDIVFARDGRRAYVSHGQVGRRAHLDPETLAVVGAVPVGPRAWSMALTPMAPSCG